MNQSEVEDSFQLASDWIKSAQENVNNLHTFGFLAVISCKESHMVWSLSPYVLHHLNYTKNCQ